jgi:hypothetical protein
MKKKIGLKACPSSHVSFPKKKEIIQKIIQLDIYFNYTRSGTWNHEIIQVMVLNP